jgi:biotin-(acetyl-CoA carboxylase) ligase
MQRSWQQPSGAALLVSIAMRPNREVAKLEQLPRAVAATLIEASPSPEIQWRSPNDLVSDADGAKVGGILIDVRTSAGVVEGLVIGVGVNVTGGAFHTLDGRAASTIEAVCGVDAHTARACAEAMYANLTSLAMELVSP